MKKAALFACLLAGTMIVSLSACGNESQTSGDPSASQNQPSASQSTPDSSQSDPEEIDLDKIAEVYSNDPQPKDQLSGKNVKVTGFLKLDRDKDALYLQATCLQNHPSYINIFLNLSPEDEALLKTEDFFLARVTLTGQIDQGMTQDKNDVTGVTSYVYNMSQASYVTNICQVTGILKQNDGIYSIDGVGDIQFLDKDNIPPVGTEVTLSGKISYGGDFRDAVVVK